MSNVPIISICQLLFIFFHQKKFPKSNDEFFSQMNDIVPGMKDLQIPLVSSFRRFWPIMKNDTAVITQIMPTLKEIINATVNNLNTTDDDFIKWGKSLLSKESPLYNHIQLWINAIKESPNQELIEKMQLLNMDKIKAYLEDYQMDMLKEIITWVQSVVVMLTGFGGSADDGLGEWFRGVLENFNNKFIEKFTFGTHPNDSV